MSWLAPTVLGNLLTYKPSKKRVGILYLHKVQQLRIFRKCFSLEQETRSRFMLSFFDSSVSQE